MRAMHDNADVWNAHLPSVGTLLCYFRETLSCDMKLSSRRFASANYDCPLHFQSSAHGVKVTNPRNVGLPCLRVSVPEVNERAFDNLPDTSSLRIYSVSPGSKKSVPMSTRWMVLRVCRCCGVCQDRTTLSGPRSSAMVAQLRTTLARGTPLTMMART